MPSKIKSIIIDKENLIITYDSTEAIKLCLECPIKGGCVGTRNPKCPLRDSECYYRMDAK